MHKESAPPRHLSDNSTLGIAAMLLSVLLFSLMDATVKWLGSSFPTQQIMFFRCLVALIPVTAIIYSRGGPKILKTQQPVMHLIRSILGVSAMGFAFYAYHADLHDNPVGTATR